MEMQQLMEFLLKELRADKEDFLAKMDANQAKAEADRKADKEVIRTSQEEAETLARLDAETKARREEMAVMRNKWVNDNRDETLACQEMEARQEEKKPTSPDRKPEAAQKDEVPAESAEVVPVGEPKKKWRRDRKLATERRRQKPKDLTRENYEAQKKLAVARRGTTRRVTFSRRVGPQQPPLCHKYIKLIFTACPTHIQIIVARRGNY
jgi:hypothetical protein